MCRTIFDAINVCLALILNNSKITRCSGQNAISSDADNMCLGIFELAKYHFVPIVSFYCRQHKFYINITKYCKSRHTVFNSSFHKSLGMPKNVWHIVNLISITILFQTQSCNARSTIK